MQKSSRIAKVLVVAAAVSLLAVACSNQRANEANTGSGGTTGGTAAGGAFTISTSSCSNYDAVATQGVTQTEIKIGSIFPQSGLYAAFAEISKGFKAYFGYLNGQGGINGKTINLVTKDADYLRPETTKAAATELDDQEKVFALFNVVGTPQNVGLRPDLNKSCLPDLFTATGSQLMGNPGKYPWVIGSIPSYATEAAVYAQYLKQNKPNAKVGILKQNDDFGDGYADAFKKAIEGTGITVVAEEVYEPGTTDVSSQIQKINSAGADALLLAVTTLTCPAAMTAVAEKQGWNPLTYVSATCSSKTLIGAAGPAANGVLTSIYLKDVNDPQWNSDQAMMQFKTVGAQQGLTPTELQNGLVAYGWTMGQLLAETIKGSASVTRKDVMEHAYNLKGLTPGVLLPGVTVNTNGPSDPYPIEQLAVGKWNGTFFEQQGPLLDFEGKTTEFVPKKD